MSCQQIVRSLSFFRFLSNLEQSGRRIPVVCSLKLTLPLIATFYLTKTANRTKTFLTELSYYCFEERYYFCHEVLTFCRKMSTSMSTSGILFKTIYVCVLTHQISSFQRNSNGFQTGGNFTHPSFLPPQEEPLKGPPRLGFKVLTKCTRKYKTVLVRVTEYRHMQASKGAIFPCIFDDVLLSL